MSELETPKTKQQQYIEQTVETIKNHITNSDGGKRLDGWLADNELTVANGKTGKTFNGLNSVKLNLQNFGDNRWLTFDQIKELGGGIKKGEKSQVVEFASFAKFVKDNSGGYKTEKLDTPIYKQYNLFNVQQTFGIDKEKLAKTSYQKPTELDIEQRGKRIEETLKNMGVKIEHTKEKTALYDINSDTITMPEKDSIPSEQYYGTLLNQMVKATANPNRIQGRDASAAYGTKEYAKEALAVEIASMTMSKEYGVRVNANLDKDFAINGKTNIEALKDWIQQGKLEDKDIKDATFKALSSQRYVLKNTPKLELQNAQKETTKAKAVEEQKVAELHKKSKSSKSKGQSR